jgi:hypothetical protein
MRVLAAVLCLLFPMVTFGQRPAWSAKPQPQPPGAPTPSNVTYTLLAWSELGMHCIDGRDYSVFSVLPPYNVVHAQLLRRGEPPVPVTSGVVLTYQARTDLNFSRNTISSTKTNFWTYVQSLFHVNPAPDHGLTDAPVQSKGPNPMSYNATLGYWEIAGVPTVPYDDLNQANAYPMATVMARDANTGAILATAPVVLSVSDEMTCSHCHSSTSGDNDAKPRNGWENDPDPNKDTKYNILKKHDDRWDITFTLPYLQQNGYYYQSTLYQTAKGGTPVLCAACHATNALGLPGVPGVGALTADMHTLHGPQINYDNGINLDNQTDPLNSCYLCHPGKVTKCQRGPMNKVACFDCHGNLTRVGQLNRDGWLDEPTCQMCHNTSQRYLTTFDQNGQWRQTSDLTFATNPNKPLQGKSLYRYSSGHGNVYCSGCHGSQHAEYPSLQANDNVYSQQFQLYTGKLTECGICHTNVPITNNQGPHTMHTIGQTWVSGHEPYAENGKYVVCAYCHGSDYRGSFLSATRTNRTFNTENGQKTFTAGHQFSCYDCHNGPQPGPGPKPTP